MTALLTEKYRPSKREEIVGNKNEIDRLFTMSQSGALTHCILEGPPGTGKTTCAIVLAKKLFGEFFRSNFLELNASDTRKIDDVRGPIKTFIKTAPFNANFKILLLDEGEDMSDEAQNALRRLMEKHSDITLIIFAVNTSEKIIDAIKSRCEIFHFAPLSNDDITERLIHVYLSEKSPSYPGGEPRVLDKALTEPLYKIAEFAQGDMRKALNHLQVLLASGEPLTAGTVETIRPVDYGKMIFDSLQKGRFFEARQNLYKAWELGYAPRYILTLIHNIYIQEDIDVLQKRDAIFALAECDYRLVLGVDKILAFDKLLLELLKK
jgi:replication factor C small subunit